MKVRIDNKTLSKAQLYDIIHEESKELVTAACIQAAQQAIKETVATLLYVKHEQHWKPQQIQKYFEDICVMYDRPAFFSKTVKGGDVVKFISEKYKLDFDKLHPHFEVRDI